MSVIAVVLLVISGCVHAGWNLVSKRQNPSAAFFLIANAVGTACILPVLVSNWQGLALIPQSVWIRALVSGFSYAVFCAAMAGAYRTGDMSLAYPLALSSPVIFVTIVTVVFGKGEPMSGWGLTGIAIVALGCFILPMRRFHEFRLSNYLNACCLLALLSAVGTTVLTIADYEALHILREIPDRPFGPVDGPLTYVIFVSAFGSFGLGALVLMTRWERESFIHILRFSKRPAALMGIGIYLAYGLVLVSMQYVTNVSYVAAFRQLSIPLGATLGVVLLKEPRYLPKIVGVVAVYVGLVVVGAA
ncbi:MAG: hypothetical protein GTN74_03435 [Proteobacteria bacterium]|nr:hypothetical protein [Pseudomonadota bacterium]NIS68298.1 hypothetical protein [Pseudomonadota bacterium]